MKNLIVYISPAGTTRTIAHAVKRNLEQRGSTVETLNLGTIDGRERFSLAMKSLGKGDCLWVGSPVYFAHPLWPMLKVLSDLKDCSGPLGIHCVPFVTYGLVKTGFSLYELGELLMRKGFTIPAAAQFVAVHSMTLTDVEPMGAGRPDKEDLSVAADLVDAACKTPCHALTLSDLDYQSEDHPFRGQKWDIPSLRGMIPIPGVDERRCVSCGLCRKNCPMDNIDGVSKPVGDVCVSCMNCVRLCPEDAVIHPGKGSFSLRAKGLFEESKEPVESKIFSS